MKKISYKYCVKSNYGTEENPEYVDAFLGKTLSCHTDEEYEKNLLVAQQEAYNGEYTVEEVDEPEAPLTDAERIAELEEALAMLLNGVTE